MIGAAMTTLAPANIFLQEAYAQEDTVALTMNKEITNPSGSQEVIDIQSAENSENAAATRTSTSSLSVQEGEDDTPANHREMTFFLPNDRTLFIIIESADESSNSVQQSNANTDNDVQIWCTYRQQSL